MSNFGSFLISVKHPVEGIAYLIYIGIVVRWKWPQNWNRVLTTLRAPIRT